MEDISIGNEIKDGYKRTDKWLKGNLTWLSEIEDFYRQRATIEKEYAEKLRQLASEAFKKKSRVSSIVSVGENPLITPGSLETASMVAWTEILTQAENIAKQKTQLARDFESRIAGDINRTQARYETIRTRWKAANDELTQTRDKNYDEVKALKKAYDDSCQAMESQRSKAERGGGQGRNQEKFEKREAEMNVAKNNYLVKINVANRLKDKYYYQDVPEILDGLQGVNEVKVSRMNTIWLSAAYLERQCNDKIDGFLKAEDEVVKQNLPRLDTAMYVKHNMGGWSEPKDFLFEPSPIWHDDETMAVEGSRELEALKMKLNESSATYEKFEEICRDEKQTVAEMLDQRNQLLGDSFKEVKIKKKEDYLKFDDLLGKSIGALQRFADDDTKRVSAEVEIEVIQTATEGKDMTMSRPVVVEKKSRFGLFKRKGRATGTDDASDDMRSLASSVSHVSITPGNSKSRVFGGIGRKLISGLRGESVSSASSSGLAMAKVKFAYEATDESELTVVVGETLPVTEIDDGSGWTQVQNGSGAKGLVPTSYLEIEQSSQSPQSSFSTKKVGPKVAPRRGAKKVKYMQVLYDYSPRGDDEMAVQAGDKVMVVSADEGSGWTEGELNGERGLFPTSYAKNV
ncbi:DEKNAAC103877 [Brettanomyces naardenensis]|uniref:Protein BZZ1 n=1 Tax=Brettanomyces naardenensis TaxID=13370 RepID=A0A448YPJ1_BRENA|nr:DEKNAAC103877 [Brettanomyces naardenensis]